VSEGIVHEQCCGLGADIETRLWGGTYQNVFVSWLSGSLASFVRQMLFIYNLTFRPYARTCIVTRDNLDVGQRTEGRRISPGEDRENRN
jgi:hypothetical protein